jgi:hypothetical protein
MSMYRFCYGRLFLGIRSAYGIFLDVKVIVNIEGLSIDPFLIPFSIIYLYK